MRSASKTLVSELALCIPSDGVKLQSGGDITVDVVMCKSAVLNGQGEVIMSSSQRSDEPCIYGRRIYPLTSG